MNTPRPSDEVARPAAEPLHWLETDARDAIAVRAVLWLTAALVVAGSVARPLLRWLRDEAIAVPYESAVRVPELDAAGTAYGTARYALRLERPAVADRLLDLLPGVALAAMAIVVIVCLERVCTAIGRGHPFARAQVTRLRVVAAVLLIGAPVHGLIRSLVDGQLLHGLALGGLPWRRLIDGSLVPSLAGIMVAVLAEAFRAGTRLRDDVDGLV